MLIDTAEWRRAAACQNADPETFFPDKGSSNAAAKRICATCPVRRDCLEDSINEPYGVWGGMSDLERKRLRTLRRHDPAAARRLLARVERDLADLTAGRDIDTDDHTPIPPPATVFDANDAGACMKGHILTEDNRVSAGRHRNGTQRWQCRECLHNRRRGAVPANETEAGELGVCMKGHQLTADNRWRNGQTPSGRQRWTCRTCHNNRTRGRVA